MLDKRSNFRQEFSVLCYTVLALLLISAMLIWPQTTFKGALYGLEIWALILVPSLLPFFIAAEIVMNLGIIKMLGILMEPIMRPIFNLPGSASFVLIMGYTSGFPMGAVLTRRFNEKGYCTLDEAERLVVFTNNSSPLFILSAVSLGMFHDLQLGAILIIAHYSSNLLLGILLGLKNRKKTMASFSTNNRSLLRDSFHVLIKSQEKQPPFGKLLGDAIKKSLINISVIGGFLLFFAVILNLLNSAGIMPLICNSLSFFLSALGLNVSYSSPLAIGFWDMTLGLKEVSLIQSLTLREKAVLASMVLGWSGISIQAQVTSMLSGSPVRTKLYRWGRIFQCCLAALLAGCLASFPQIFLKFAVTLPVWSPYSGLENFFMQNLCFTGKLFSLILFVIITGVITSLVVSWTNKILQKII